MQNKVKQCWNKLKYESLTPEYYGKARKEHKGFWKILKDRKNYNIAVSGGYSSGKSTLLFSIFKKSKFIQIPILGNILMFFDNKLSISFATFKEEEDTGAEDEYLIKNVEENIIKKIYYATQLKYTIRKEIKYMLISFCITVFIYAVMQICKENVKWIKTVSEIEYIIYLILIFSFIIVNFINKISSLKVSVGNVEAELCKDEVNDNNVFNKNLNLIFNRIRLGGTFLGYRYIVFEDLDRFKQPKIFEQLRDLNDTLNLRMFRKVKFIYAIKDDMFKDENRTKFFDFIYPLIPYVSYSNSGEKMLELLKNHNIEDDELPEQFILDVCLYVADMRILKNTLNEYITYKEQLHINLEYIDYKKLFSIILYKNTCSNDFSELQENRGILYETIKSKDKYIKVLKNTLTQEIKDKQEKVDIISNIIFSVEDCKRLIISKIINSQPINHTIGLYHNRMEINNLSIRTNPNELNDEYLYDKDMLIYNSSNSSNNINLVQFLKNNCSSEMHIIKQSDSIPVDEEGKLKTEEIKKEIDIIKEEIKNLDNMKLSYLLSENKINMQELKPEKYVKLIRFLLLNGYIDEDYNMYISKTYTGSLTERDINFKTALLSGQELDCKFVLDNPDKLLTQLAIDVFKRPGILNIYIFDNLLSIKKDGTDKEFEEFKQKFEEFLKVLKISKIYIEFINSCLNEVNGFKNSIECIDTIIENDRDFITKIKNEDLKKSIILNIMINVLNIKIPKEVEDAIIAYINENNLGLITLDKEDTIYQDEKIKEIIKEKNVKYKDISNIKDMNNIIEFVIKNNHYEINTKNVMKILEINGITQELASKCNYDAINKISFLKSYVLENLDIYISDVYLKNDIKQENSSDSLLELLNLNIKDEYKEKIIENETNPVISLKDLNDTEQYSKLLECGLISLTSKNINTYYEYIKELEEGREELQKLCDFIFSHDEFENIIKDTNDDFVRYLLLNESIDDTNYEKLINSTDLILTESDNIKELSNNKIKLLIKNDKIIISTNVYRWACDLEDEEIHRMFIEQNQSYFLDILGEELILGYGEIVEAFNYNICDDLKLKLLSGIDIEGVESINVEFANEILEFIGNRDFTVNITFTVEFANKILEISTVNNLQYKLKLLEYAIDYIVEEQLESIFNKLGGEYTKILKNRTACTFNNIDIDKSILEKVKSFGYNVQYEEKNNMLKVKRTIRRS